MKGLDILTNGYLEKVNNGSTSLSLLGRGGGIEMMKQTVLKDKMFVLFPSKEADVQEFFYILNGRIEAEVDGETIELGSDDFFSARNLEGSVYFTAITDITLLTVSTVPVFHSLSKDIRELRKVGETVEKKDPYTFKHSSRVAKYSVKIATKMNLSREKTENIFLAAILHDIGKVNIPEDVLKKPEPLTGEEFSLVKKHPVDGAAMIRETIYADLADIVEQHHERLDGRGYPYGLTDSEILVEAKIIGVADTFDAMTEDRAYRKACAPEVAIRELKRLSGIQFDKEVVEAFEQVLFEEGKLS